MHQRRMAAEAESRTLVRAVDQERRACPLAVSDVDRDVVLTELFHRVIEVARPKARQVSHEDRDWCIGSGIERAPTTERGSPIHPLWASLQHDICACLQRVHGYGWITGHHQDGADSVRIEGRPYRRGSKPQRHLAGFVARELQPALGCPGVFRENNDRHALDAGVGHCETCAWCLGSKP